ncbi:MAG: energy transducer TonB [Lewinella sp.]
MNTPYLRTGLFLAALFTAIAFALQPGPRRCGSVDPYPKATGDLHVYAPGQMSKYGARPNIELPTFPGCDDPDYEQRSRCGRVQLGRYLNKNLNKRVIGARKGRVKIAYSIGLDGKLFEAELASGSDPVLAAETMRMIGLMQGQDLRWRPAKIDGQLRKMTVLLQVSYGLRCESCWGLDEEMAITWVPELQ